METNKLLQITHSELQACDRATQHNREVLKVMKPLKEEVKCVRKENECSQHQVTKIRINFNKNEERLQLEIEMWIRLKTLSQSHERKLLMRLLSWKWQLRLARLIIVPSTVTR